MYIQTVKGMIRVMMDLNNYAEKQGTTSNFAFELIDLKRKIKEDVVFVKKAKTYFINVTQDYHLFDFVAADCCFQ